MPEADHDFGPDSADKLLAALEAFPYVGLVTIGGGPGQYIAADEPSKETLQSEHLLDSSGTTRLIRGIDAVTFNWLDEFALQNRLGETTASGAPFRIRYLYDYRGRYDDRRADRHAGRSCASAQTASTRLAFARSRT